jgi:GxxExxY protein
MDENAVAKIVVDAAFHIHKRLGPGLLENVYETILVHELEKRGLAVQRQLTLPVAYESLTIKNGYRVDLLVNNLVVVELKSVMEMHPVYNQQLRTYLKLSGKRLGLLINFNEVLVKDGITRIANGMPS